jgi:hypothetical protein
VDLSFNAQGSEIAEPTWKLDVFTLQQLLISYAGSPIRII